MIRKYRVFILLAVLAAIAVGVYLVLNSAKWATYTVNSYTFAYDKSLFVIDEQKVSKLAYPSKVDIYQGGLKISAKNYTISISLQNVRLPNTNAYSWYGEPEKYLETDGNSLTSASSLFTEYNNEYLACNYFDGISCSILVKNDEDELYYPMERSILGYDASSIYISYTNADDISKSSNEIKQILNSVLNAKKD